MPLTHPGEPARQDVRLHHWHVCGGAHRRGGGPARAGHLWHQPRGLQHGHLDWRGGGRAHWRGRRLSDRAGCGQRGGIHCRHAGAKLAPMGSPWRKSFRPGAWRATLSGWGSNKNAARATRAGGKGGGPQNVTITKTYNVDLAIALCDTLVHRPDGRHSAGVGGRHADL